MSKEPEIVPQWSVKDWGSESARLVATTPLPDGLYTLIADRWADAAGLERVRGDYVQLDAPTASRLGAEGAIAPPDSSWAEGARARSGTHSADLRADQE